jgi:hypothetical protein
MSVSVRIQRQACLVCTRFSGRVTDDDVRQQIKLIAEGAPYDGKYFAITDFTHVERFDVTTEMIRSVASQPSPLASAKRVIVAPGDVQYGVSRMFQALSHDTRPDITVVRSMAEACTLLNISPEALA